ncbi:MAG: globin domain-containing protein [Nocardioidaceae bacterium]
MDVAALQDSWDTVAKSGDEVPLYFYSHLFLSHPELRELFPIAMSGQRDKLVSALGAIVSNVHQIDQVVGFVQQLGRDHRRFSVAASHYDAVGASLLATLRQFLGDDWTDSLAADWAAAYGLVAKTMIEAAEQDEETAPAWWTAEVTQVERRTTDVGVVQLKPYAEYPYEPGQSMAVEIPQRPRLWRYFSPANAPRPDWSIELHVQIVDGGLVSGSVVRQLRSGDTVKLGRAVGERFTLPATTERDLLLIAGGTGLSPFRALLEQFDIRWQENGTAPRVHLFHGARMPWNLYARDEMSRLTARPWFDYTEVVSEDSTFPGTRGMVGTAAARGPLEGRLAMVCGSPRMVEQTVSELTAAGLSEDDIRSEQLGNMAGSTSPQRTTVQAGERS